MGGLKCLEILCGSLGRGTQTTAKLRGALSAGVCVLWQNLFGSRPEVLSRGFCWAGCWGRRDGQEARGEKVNRSGLSVGQGPKNGSTNGEAWPAGV